MKLTMDLATESNLNLTSQLGGDLSVGKAETSPFPELELFCEVEPYQESYLGSQQRF